MIIFSDLDLAEMYIFLNFFFGIEIVLSFITIFPNRGDLNFQVKSTGF